MLYKQITSSIQQRRQTNEDSRDGKRPKFSCSTDPDTADINGGGRSTAHQECVSLNDLMKAIQMGNDNIARLEKRIGILEKRPTSTHGDGHHIPRCSNPVAAPYGFHPISRDTPESEYARYVTLEKVFNSINLQYATKITLKMFKMEVEIGRPGSNVCITADQWDTAADKSTFTQMTSSLLVALFPHEVLLESNLRGGKSKIDKFAEQFMALDTKILKSMVCKKLRISNELINHNQSTCLEIMYNSHNLKLFFHRYCTQKVSADVLTQNVRYLHQ